MLLETHMEVVHDRVKFFGKMFLKLLKNLVINFQFLILIIHLVTEFVL